VVALEVGLVPLEEVEVPVDVLDEAELAGQEVDGADAAWRDGADPVGDLVMDVGGGHHRLMAFYAGLVLDAAEDSPLAAIQLAVETGVHSKTSWGKRTRSAKSLDCSLKPGGFRASGPQST
jgi:hypothetical protein